MGSTDQACFYGFLKINGTNLFLQYNSLSFLQGLRNLKNVLLQKLSMKRLDQNFWFLIKKWTFLPSWLCDKDIPVKTNLNISFYKYPHPYQNRFLASKCSIIHDRAVGQSENQIFVCVCVWGGVGINSLSLLIQHFWFKNDGEKWSRIFCFEIQRASSELLLPSAKKIHQRAS